MVVVVGVVVRGVVGVPDAVVGVLVDAVDVDTIVKVVVVGGCAVVVPMFFEMANFN